MLDDSETSWISTFSTALAVLDKLWKWPVVFFSFCLWVLLQESRLVCLRNMGFEYHSAGVSVTYVRLAQSSDDRHYGCIDIYG